MSALSGDSVFPRHAFFFRVRHVVRLPRCLRYVGLSSIVYGRRRTVSGRREVQWIGTWFVVTVPDWMLAIARRLGIYRPGAKS